MSRTNVPAARAALIGREADLIALVERIRSVPGRLVTISGIGGIGKTSLALTVARHVTASFQRR
jgi:ATP-dependent Lon protease